MARPPFTLLSALSLMLCAATAVLWVRSLSRTDAFAHTRGRITYEVASRAGVACIAIARRTGRDIDRMPVAGELLLPDVRGRWTSHGTVRCVTALQDGHPDDQRTTIQYFAASYAVLLTAAGATPLLWLALRIRGPRNRRGKCRRCGYNLRATPGRCPECGAAAPTPERAA
jgi:hypothetical protein